MKKEIPPITYKGKTYWLVTPCCKTRYWNLVFTHQDPEGTVRCQRCDNKFDREDFVRLGVKKGLNPVTFYCDHCYISAETTMLRKD